MSAEYCHRTLLALKSHETFLSVGVCVCATYVPNTHSAEAKALNTLELVTGGRETVCGR